MVGRQSHRLMFGIGILAASFALVAGINASSVLLIPPTHAAESTTAIVDFAGYWARPEPARGAARYYALESGPKPVDYAPAAGDLRQGIPYIGDDSNPILLPHAAEAIRAQRETYARGEAVWSAWALCWPTGIPLNFGMVNALQFLQGEDEVTMIYQRGQTVRHIYLNGKHPPDPKQTWFGHSVGHYEGPNTFVIDTIAQDPRALLDRFGTPKSEAIRVVERYSLSADRQRLDVFLTVEDPKTFTTSWSATVAYERLPPKSGESPQDEVFAEIVCPENNRDAGGGGYPIPTATTFDF